MRDGTYRKACKRLCYVVPLLNRAGTLPQQLRMERMTKPFKLRRGEFCRIHSSYFCCGREAPSRRSSRIASRRQKAPNSKWTFVGRGIWRIPDLHHFRGYRERRNDAAMHELVKQKISEQHNCCAICHEEFTDSSQIVGEHKEPKGMGGARRDDHPDNIQAAHSYPCNIQKGSRRIAS